MLTANKTTSTINPCPDCPSGSEGGVGVSLSDTALNNIINNLQLGAADKVMLTWLKLEATPAELLAMNKFLEDNVNSEEIHAFLREAINALMNGKFVDFNEAYIEDDAPDDGYTFQGFKQLIPNPLILSNGDMVEVNFISYTKDNISSNQQVATDLINGLKYAIEQANNNLLAADKITSINIYATTNGEHGVKSNHYDGTSLDINRINGLRIAELGITNQIIELQKAFDNFQYIRENFGPYFKHKYSVELDTWDYNKISAGAHSDHIHISIRR
ncbi:MAG: hypothetical protein GW774_14725 [Flavobacteriales bacterium]|nr:hypothetical protein [Flavobacteriales bacterium]